MGTSPITLGVGNGAAMRLLLTTPAQRATPPAQDQPPGAGEAEFVICDQAIEQAHQQLKEELGLDHFEGRCWTGLHRHALMTMMVFTFLQHLRLEQAGGRGKKRPSRIRTATATHPAGGPAPPA